jgi:hypothetical protein
MTNEMTNERMGNCNRRGGSSSIRQEAVPRSPTLLPAIKGQTGGLSGGGQLFSGISSSGGVMA